MKIGPIRRQRRNGRWAVCADLFWEDVERSPVEIAFSFDDEAGAEPAPNPDAFLIGAFLSALRAGERRVRVEGEVSPVLRDGLRDAAALLDAWYGERRRIPAIEPAAGFRARRPASGAGVFVSGGLDSLFLLTTLHRRHVPSDPKAVRLGIVIDGLARVPAPATAARISAFSRAAASAIAARAGIPLTVVSTNLIELHADFEFFARQSHGSFLGAIAQLHAGRIASAWEASSDDVASGLGPWGSHPLLDPLFGTEAVAVVHDGTGHSRAEKARLLADTPEARDHLFVCFDPPDDRTPNCGRCEKCLRTMLEILVCGGLAHSRVFPRDVDPADILAGRADLADAVEHRLEMERRVRDWHADRGRKGRLRRLDRARLGGRLLAWRRRMARWAAPGT